jgi:hypothetical protein
LQSNAMNRLCLYTRVCLSVWLLPPLLLLSVPSVPLACCAAAQASRHAAVAPMCALGAPSASTWAALLRSCLNLKLLRHSSSCRQQHLCVLEIQCSSVASAAHLAVHVTVGMSASATTGNSNAPPTSFLPASLTTSQWLPLHISYTSPKHLLNLSTLCRLCGCVTHRIQTDVNATTKGKCCSSTEMCFRGLSCCTVVRQCGAQCCPEGQICQGGTTCCNTNQACGNTCW